MYEGFQEDGERGHPVVDGVAGVRDKLLELGEASFFGLTDDELVEQMGQVQEAVWQAEELLVRTIGEVDARGRRSDRDRCPLYPAVVGRVAVADGVFEHARLDGARALLPARRSADRGRTARPPAETRPSYESGGASGTELVGNRRVRAPVGR